MARVFVAGLIIIGGLMAIGAPASAEDGGQYYRGGNGAVSQPASSTFQR